MSLMMKFISWSVLLENNSIFLFRKFEVNFSGRSFAFDFF